jgi:hypothetical protein
MVLRPEDVNKMVEIVSVHLRNGVHIEVRAPMSEAAWLRALFTRNAEPFKALRDMGYEV